MKPIDSYFNNALLGSMILSMSKRIMNEVMCLAHDVVPNSIYYQDTDSMHILSSAIPVLERAFKQKYGTQNGSGKELIGKDMGQFHSDFCSRDGNDQVDCACESFFIAKKIYCDVLKMKDESLNIMYRMKGICRESTESEAQERYPDSDIVKSIRKLYEALFEGNRIDFDLCKGGKPLFEHNNDFSISSKRSFVRRVSS
jgi:hypothetical protein